MINITPIRIAKIDILLIPVVFLLTALGLWLSDLNTETFIYVNTLSFLANQAMWANITILGDALVLVSLLALFIKVKPQWVLAGLIAALISGVVVQLMKYGFDIDRPIAILERAQIFLVGEPPTARSFPSGHTASIFVFAAIIFFAINNKITAALILLLAVLVAISRIMVAAHWPIDLLVGASIGWLSAYVGIYISNRFKRISRLAIIMMALFIVVASVLLLFHQTGYEDAQWLQWAIAVSMSVLSLYSLYQLAVRARAPTA